MCRCKIREWYRITRGCLPLVSGWLLCFVPGTRCSITQGWGTKGLLCCRRILTMAIAAIIMIIMKTKESMPTKDWIQGLECCFSVPCLYQGLQSLYVKQITTRHGKELFCMERRPRNTVVRSSCMSLRSESHSKDIKWEYILQCCGLFNCSLRKQSHYLGCFSKTILTS